jgi:hypothetical protein
MILTNVEQEDIWINGWEDLYGLLETHPGAYIVLPDNIEVSLAEAQSWIQEAAYTNHRLVFNTGFFKGKKSIFIFKASA